MNVIEMRKCARCGKPARQRELLYRGVHVDFFDSCSSCIKEIDDRLDRVRPVFDAMIDAGIDNAIANETMTFLLNKIDP